MSEIVNHDSEFIKCLSQQVDSTFTLWMAQCDGITLQFLAPTTAVLTPVRINTHLASDEDGRITWLRGVAFENEDGKRVAYSTHVTPY